MDATRRIIINTSSQYIRTIIGGILTLYSARIILHSLGADDFGIYSLVAGVVMMLSFITNALSSTTQRYISYFQGKSDRNQVKIVFANSIILHIGIGLLMIILLFLVYPFLFNIISVPVNREGAASYVYLSVMGMLFLSFIASPFRAVLISRENIVYISIVEIVEYIIKFLIALSLSSVSCDKLAYYGIMLMFVQLFNLLVLGFYCFFKYEECIYPRKELVNASYIKGLSGFAGWSIYTIGCQVGRTQGLNILINHVFGALANAAYGLALQVSSYANLLSDALLNSIKPQIIKAEGGGDRDRMLGLSELACKYGFFLISFICIPCLFETNKLLELWLKNVPEHTVLFTRMYLISMMLDMLTLNLNITNQAIGKLGLYTVCVNTGKLLTVPLSYCLLKLGLPLVYVSICYVLIEFISAMVRLPIIKHQTGMHYRNYFKNVILKILPSVVISFTVCLIITSVINVSYRIILTFFISMLAYFISFLFLGMSEVERNKVFRVIFKRFR